MDFQALNPVALRLGAFSIRWYGILIALGVLLATRLAVFAARRSKLDIDQLYDLIFYTGLSGIIGARLYYVAFNWSYFRQDYWSILYLWHGGIAIHGALLAGALAIYLYTKLHRLPLLSYLDCIVLGLPLGQALGRWGNFFNQEAFGSPTELPWKIYITPEHRPTAYLYNEYFHPTFFYESLWDLLTFLILLFFFRKQVLKKGELTYIYFIVYSLGRFAIEGLRLDSLYLGPLRAAQVVSVLLFLLGLSLLLWNRYHPLTQNK